MATIRGSFGFRLTPPQPDGRVYLYCTLPPAVVLDLGGEERPLAALTWDMMKIDCDAYIAQADKSYITLGKAFHFRDLDDDAQLELLAYFGSNKDKFVPPRCVVIKDGDKDQINLVGFGSYLGDRPCPLLGGKLNPCIKLDDGNIVWGCQVWWQLGDADALAYVARGRKVVTVGFAGLEVPKPSKTSAPPSGDLATAHDDLDDEDDEEEEEAPVVEEADDEDDEDDEDASDYSETGIDEADGRELGAPKEEKKPKKKMTEAEARAMLDFIAGTDC